MSNLDLSPFKKIDNKKAIMTLLTRVLLLLLFESLIYQTMMLDNSIMKFVIITPLIFLCSLSFVSLFVIGHDCGHYRFHTNRQINNLVGHLCMSSLLTGFHNWRISHGHHHIHTNKLGQDPDWPFLMVTKKQYQELNLHDKLTFFFGYRTPLGLIVGFSVGMIKRTFMSLLMPFIDLSQRDKRDLFVSNMIVLIVSTTIITGIYQFSGANGLIYMYALPALLAMCWGTLLTFLHHSHEGIELYEEEEFDYHRAQLNGTVNVRFPKWIEFFICDINIHIPHHVSMSIPWYHLKAADQVIRNENPKSHQEESFKFSMLYNFWMNPFLNENKKGVYRIN